MFELNWDEKRRLEKIGLLLYPSYGGALLMHFFNKASTPNGLEDELTEAERIRKSALSAELTNTDASGFELKALQIQDIYAAAARRANGNDAELAALIRTQQLTVKDADLLDKCDLYELAALVRLKAAPPSP